MGFLQPIWGASLGAPPKHLWSPVIERLEKKLALWKANYLSLGGRITLIKSVLSNLLIYFLSLYKCLMENIKHIEKLQRDFLGRGSEVKIKFHLVRWNLVRKSKKGGGLGIKSIKTMNQALLAKWLWRLGDKCFPLNTVLPEEDGKCAVILVNIWKGIFSKFTHQHVGKGDNVLVWLDT